MNFSDWQKEVWQVADEHGWHDTPHTIGESLALIHSEISEALEEYRKGKMELYYADPTSSKYVAEEHKPEGFGTELADAIIRILHLAEREGLNMDELVTLKNNYNKTRSYKHGGKVI